MIRRLLILALLLLVSPSIHNQNATDASGNPVRVPFTSGVWHCIEAHLKVNNPGVAANGILEMWSDGVQVMRYDAVRYVSVDNGTFENVMIPGFWNCSPPQPGDRCNASGDARPLQYRWTDTMVVSTARINCPGVAPNPDTTPPTVTVTSPTAGSTVSGSISLSAVATDTETSTANLWLTEPGGSARLTQQTALTFEADSGTNPITIAVDPTISYQTMVGFGGTFGFFSYDWLCNTATSGQRAAFINAMFSPTTGIGLSVLRQGMGSDWDDIGLPDPGGYTYDDMPAGQTDVPLTNFAIPSYELACTVTLVQDAKAANPGLKIIGTPWSAPGWMKTPPDALIGGSFNSTYYAVYAQYFVKYIQAYTALGLAPYAVTVQNEPTYSPPNYQGMLMSQAQEIAFIGSHLGPALAAAGLPTKIYAWDMNWNVTSRPLAILGDAAANPYTTGIAWHWYSGQPTSMTTVHNAFPNKDHWVTEASSGCSGPQTFDGALINDMQKLTIGSTRNWATAVLKYYVTDGYMNNAADSGGGCWGLVALQTSGSINYGSGYYSLGHASKFVKPGAVRIASNTYAENVEDVAFRNPDGSIVVVVANINASTRAIKITWPDGAGTKMINYTMPSRSVATFTWN